MPLHPDDPSASSPSYVFTNGGDPAHAHAYAEKCAFYSGMPVLIRDEHTPDHDAEQERADGWLLP